MKKQFIPLQVYGGFIIGPRADNPTVNGPIWPKFEIFLDIMHVLVNYENEFKIDWINNNREKVATSVS